VAHLFENFDIKFNNLPESDFEAMKNFVHSDLKHLYISGGTGTGKTHLAKAIANQAGKYTDNFGTYWHYKFLEADEFYFLMQDYVHGWKKINEDLLPEYSYKTIKRSTGIVIDDIGTEMTSEPEAVEYGLRDLITKSVAKIILTANMTAESFKKRYGSKIGSRFFDKRICLQVEFDGKKDYRMLGGKK